MQHLQNVWDQSIGAAEGVLANERPKGLGLRMTPRLGQRGRAVRTPGGGGGTAFGGWACGRGVGQ